MVCDCINPEEIFNNVCAKCLRPLAENKPRWNYKGVSLDNNLAYQMSAEITKDGFKELRNISAEFSRKLIEQEEAIVITSMETQAIFKLVEICRIELARRGERIRL